MQQRILHSKRSTISTHSYRGRFAPSPSGFLHFGSLISALASFLDAKSTINSQGHQGTWLVRIEDIDPPREQAGASSAILSTLEAFGLHWDEQVLYQSQQSELYKHTLHNLQQQNLSYYCQCTRSDIKALGGVYQGHCRSLNAPAQNSAIRLSNLHGLHQFDDIFQGEVSCDKNFAAEDFIIHRKDGLFAYQLVVVLDDINQNINHIVRGADLLEPTVRQIALFNQFNKQVPSFAHVPLAVAAPGFKLSKQNYAPSIDIEKPQLALFDALRFLGQNPPIELLNLNVAELINWAISHWNIASVPKVNEIQLIKDENIPHCQFLSL